MTGFRIILFRIIEVLFDDWIALLILIVSLSLCPNVRYRFVPSEKQDIFAIFSVFDDCECCTQSANYPLAQKKPPPIVLSSKCENNTSFRSWRKIYVYVSDHILYAVIINCSYSAKQYLVWSQLSKSRLQFFSFSVHKTQKSNIFQKQALKNVFFAECATKYQTFVQ